MKRTRLTEGCEKLLRNLITRIFHPILHTSSNQEDGIERSKKFIQKFILKPKSTRKITVKSKLFLSSHKSIWGVKPKLHLFLASALYGVKWSALRPSRFTHGKKRKR